MPKADGHDPLYLAVGQRVEVARRAAGMSQAKLANAVSLTRASIVNIEHGRQRPPLHVLWQIAEALQVDPAELIPRRSELAERTESVHLDRAVVRQIQKVAENDPEAKRLLTAFIQRATAQITGTDDVSEEGDKARLQA